MSSARKPRTPPVSPPPAANELRNPPNQNVSLPVQLKCAQRELALRKSAYPGWVRAGRLNVFKAEEEITAMAAIVKTLQDLVAAEKPQ